MKIVLYTIAFMVGFPGIVLAAHITYNSKLDNASLVVIWAVWLALIIP